MLRFSDLINLFSFFFLSYLSFSFLFLTISRCGWCECACFRLLICGFFPPLEHFIFFFLLFVCFFFVCFFFWSSLKNPSSTFAILRLFEPQPWAVQRTPALFVQWVLLGQGQTFDIRINGTLWQHVQGSSSSSAMLDLTSLPNGRYQLSVTASDALTRYPLSYNQTDSISGTPASLFAPIVTSYFDLAVVPVALSSWPLAPAFTLPVGDCGSLVQDAGVYRAICANSSGIWTAASSDGRNWGPSAQLLAVSGASSPVALRFRGTFFLYFGCGSGGSALCAAVSDAWTGPWVALASPVIAATAGRASVVVHGRGSVVRAVVTSSTGQLTSCMSSSGVVFSCNQPQSIAALTADTDVKVERTEDMLLLVTTLANGSLAWTCSFDGTLWQDLAATATSSAGSRPLLLGCIIKERFFLKKKGANQRLMNCSTL